MNIKLQFKVERSLGDPHIRIIIDDHWPSFEGPCLEEIDLDLPVISGEHELRITHYGKHTDDHVWDSEGRVVVDKHVEITGIWFDGVKLDAELWNGEFFPVYHPDYLKTLTDSNIEIPYSIKPNLYLGHNGTWKLPFSYPSTEWLVKMRQEKIYGVHDPDFLTGEEDMRKARAYFAAAPDLPWDHNV